MTAEPRRSPMLLLVLGLICGLLGLAAIIVQGWRWAEGVSNFNSSSVAILMGVMFLTFGAALVVAAVRSNK